MRIFGHRLPAPGPRLGIALAVLALCAACGKKGPPLLPHDLSPAAPTAVRARRLGDRVYLTFTIPNGSARGTGPYSIDHLEVFAVTIGPGMVVPPNRDLLLKPQVIGTIPVRQIEEEEAETEAAAAPAPPAPASDLPRPGDETTFIETLAASQLEPRVLGKPEKTVKPAAPREASRGRSGRGGTGTGAPGIGGRATPPVPPGPAVLSRYYVIRGVTKKGKPGGPSARVIVPLLAAPEPPRVGPTASWDATSVTIVWDPPPSRSDEVSGLTYDVYAANANAAGPLVPVAGAGRGTAPEAKGTPPPALPLNPLPLDVTSFTKTGAEADKEQCFVVRSVAVVGVPPELPSIIESDPSAPICVTPKDTFPPEAPKSLAAVASAGAINLIWDANVEPDLAGYLVLRAEAPGATLQPLMREPIKETRYGDRTAQPGVRYVYAIIAVDKAGNRSAPSNRVEDAAR